MRQTLPSILGKVIFFPMSLLVPYKIKLNFLVKRLLKPTDKITIPLCNPKNSPKARTHMATFINMGSHTHRNFRPHMATCELRTHLHKSCSGNHLWSKLFVKTVRIGPLNSTANPANFHPNQDFT